ncbi:MAG: 3-phosphoshikimate 1-carboxyvinyltransferase, partial [Bacteroidia bacterium]|nr:3-phosphoshikimate 1-carboxyvinyltransferase [Bacteroidia bacterium]
MSSIQIEPIKQPLRGHVVLPLSKSISNRQLVLGAHTYQPFEVIGVSEAQDTRYLIEALRQCGYSVED